MIFISTVSILKAEGFENKSNVIDQTLNKLNNSKTTPKILNGWLYKESGYYTYYINNHKQTGWKFINNHLYWFNKKGEGNLHTGWERYHHKWMYSYGKYGYLANHKYKRYYFDKNGYYHQRNWVSHGLTNPLKDMHISQGSHEGGAIDYQPHAAFLHPGKVHVYASHSGYLHCGYNGHFGNFITLHSSNHYSLYAHLAFCVKRRGWVNQGTYIGTIGESGNSTGVHLHYKVR